MSNDWICKMLSPCQDEYEDQELSTYKVDILCEYEVELTVEKADDDAQYGTGNVCETNAYQQ